ncbi:adenylosuccinate synthetase [Acrocarpospora catenulata]|uniref:adenylosuccinate synthetase n=1 Tax=Acrocarpospora catenulata TaxID=2836182 RepID=UPI001BDB5633|nr:adenylosuccinate synthetase [Acrocarpospora catenulata]
MDEHLIIADLGYGDAGKGTIVDWLCSRSQVHAVVRYNGGAQAGHNVVTPDGRHHTFAQFGSGTFWGVPTFLSRFMMVDPLALAAEHAHLRWLGVPDPFELLTVAPEALVTTPYHKAVNRARERARGAARHGSCGMGVGETASYAVSHSAAAPRVADCGNPRALRLLLRRLREWVLDEVGPVPTPAVEDVADAFHAFAGRIRTGRLPSGGPLVFEGAQGVLLDERYGFHPYTTWSTTTFTNAFLLLGEAGAGDAKRMGVLRTYATRHGAGPFVTEDPALTLPERHNATGEWQGAFRVGHLDLVATRYAVRVCGGVDELALTHLDVAEEHRELRVCRAYDQQVRLTPGDLANQAALAERLATARPVLEPVPGPWPAFVADELGAPVTVTSSGPTWLDKRVRRVPRGQRSPGWGQRGHRVQRKTVATAAGAPSW